MRVKELVGCKVVVKLFKPSSGEYIRRYTGTVLHIFPKGVRPSNADVLKYYFDGDRDKMCESKHLNQIMRIPSLDLVVLEKDNGFNLIFPFNESLYTIIVVSKGEKESMKETMEEILEKSIGKKVIARNNLRTTQNIEGELIHVIPSDTKLTLADVIKYYYGGDEKKMRDDRFLGVKLDSSILPRLVIKTDKGNVVIFYDTAKYFFEYYDIEEEKKDDEVTMTLKLYDYDDLNVVGKARALRDYREKLYPNITEPNFSGEVKSLEEIAELLKKIDYKYFADGERADIIKQYSFMGNTVRNVLRFKGLEIVVSEDKR